MHSHTHEEFADRFAAACRADTRIAAAFVGGSRGAGTADAHADLDLYLILRDDTYNGFFADRRAFMGQLGHPVFLEDFNGFGFDMLLFIYADGVEGELVLHRASDLAEIKAGPFRPLVDRDAILPFGTLARPTPPEEAEQREQLRWLVQWFWRDLSQLSRCLARAKLWSAYGYLQMMQQTCIRLARLKHDWTAALDGFYDIEGAADPEDLADVQKTLCRVEHAAIVGAVRAMIELYERIVVPLAAEHDITYPRDLRAVVLDRFDAACSIRR